MEWGILIPVVAIIFGCGIPLSAIWTEYLRDRALIEKGLYQPKQPSAHPGWGLLLAGSIVTSMGIALVVSAFIFHIGKAIGIPGLVFLSIGMALLIVYSIAGKKKVITENKTEGG